MKIIINSRETCIQAPPELILRVKKTSKISSILSFISQNYFIPIKNLKLLKGQQELSPNDDLIDHLSDVQLCVETIFPTNYFLGIKYEIEQGNNDGFLMKFLQSCDEGFSMDRIKDGKGWSLIHYACFYGNLAALSNLLASNEKSVNLVTTDGWTPLMVACEKGHIQVIKYLLEDKHIKSKIKVNKLTTQGTALHKAVQSCNPQTVRLLLKHRASPKIEDSQGRTCIEIPTSVEILELIPKLIGLYEAFKNFKLSPSSEFLFKVHRVGARFCRDYTCTIEVNFKSGRFEEKGKKGKLKFKKKIIKLLQIHSSAFPLSNEKFYFKLTFPGHVLKYWVSSEEKRQTTIDNLKKASDFCKWSEIGVRNYEKVEVLKARKGLLSETEEKHSKTVKLNEFQKVKKLGNGSFGTVYLIRHRYTDELFALKTTDREINIKGRTKYAIAECEILKSVNSKFIVKLYWAIATNSHLHLILEFCPGCDLSKILEIKHVLSESETRFVLASIILALKHLHLKNIVCRDLKPANILISQLGYFKLCDFGLSQNRVEGEKMNAKLVGSPSYLSPEGIISNKVGKSADIWALGVVAFQLLSGDLPFQGTDYNTLYDQILKKDINYPAHISHVAKNFLQFLLNRDPKTRPTIDQVMSHELFTGLDWRLYELQKYESPEFFKGYLKND